jgi:hypothetical protein
MGVISLPEHLEGGIVHQIAEKHALGTPPGPPATHRPETHIDGGKTAAPVSSEALAASRGLKEHPRCAKNGSHTPETGPPAPPRPEKHIL